MGLSKDSSLWHSNQLKAKLLKSSIARVSLLAGASLLVVLPFLWWGIPSGHDFEFHMFSWMEVLGQWKQGILYPRWAALAHWGYGEARFLFYPPASWTLGAALGAILPWTLVPSTYCWLAITLAAASMYRLAREWLDPADALFAAIFYALNPYHLLIVYWRSAYAELLAAALLPLLVLCLLRVYDPKSGSRPSLRPTLWLSLTLAAAWLTNAPAAVMIHYSAAGLALLLAIMLVLREGRSGPIWRPLLQTAAAVLLGAGLASFYLLPAIYEQHWINLAEVLSPGVRPQDNFLFTTIADADHNRFNDLVSTVALFEIAALLLAVVFSYLSRAKRATSSGRMPWKLLSAWGLATVIVMLSVSNPLWLYLPKFRFIQLPFRWLLCMNAALALLLTISTRRWLSRSFIFLILLAAVIVAGYRIQPPWWDNNDDVSEMRDAVAAGSGSGYEGTDEYVPVGADAYELNKDQPRITDASGSPLPIKVLAWLPTEKHFTTHSPATQNVTVRLFSYPAWEVLVNDQVTFTEKTPVTGLIIIPISAGDSDVRIRFRWTADREIGDAVSLLSLIVFISIWLRTRRHPSAQIHHGLPA
jgi:6-pyruvoyl-tetrahydropterin synthase related domain